MLRQLWNLIIQFFRIRPARPGTTYIVEQSLDNASWSEVGTFRDLPRAQKFAEVTNEGSLKWRPVAFVEGDGLLSVSEGALVFRILKRTS